MLIFNCTEAASKFFSRVHKGKTITPVEAQPPSPTPEEDELGDSAEQWLVHVITVQRKHVLFVIHIKTRYCMIFADAKKADVEGFIQRFTERWIYGLIHHAAQHDILQWVDDEPMMEPQPPGHVSQNPTIRFAYFASIACARLAKSPATERPAPLATTAPCFSTRAPSWTPRYFPSPS